MDVPSPSPSLVPACYDSGSGPLLLHWSLAGLQQPGPAECAELADSFPGAVSLIECAEQLRQWGAAPEQRLALYFRRLPSVSGWACRWFQCCACAELEGATLAVWNDWSARCFNGPDRSPSSASSPPCCVPQSPDSEARLVSVVPHTGAWEQRVALLRANLAREGPTAGELLAACAAAHVGGRQCSPQPCRLHMRVLPVLLANKLGSPPLRQSVDCGLLRSPVPAQA